MKWGWATGDATKHAQHRTRLPTDTKATAYRGRASLTQGGKHQSKRAQQRTRLPTDTKTSAYRETALLTLTSQDRGTSMVKDLHGEQRHHRMETGQERWERYDDSTPNGVQETAQKAPRQQGRASQGRSQAEKATLTRSPAQSRFKYARTPGNSRSSPISATGLAREATMHADTGQPTRAKRRVH